MVSLEEQKEFIKNKGWSQWYNERYWVHQKTVSDPTTQNHTNYGMDLNSAYCFEVLNLPPFEPMFFPRLSQKTQGLENRERIEELLKDLEKEIF